MPILLDSPVIIPATQQKIYDGLFITDLIVHCDTLNGTAYISYCPYSTTTGEILQNEKKNIFVDDFWKCVGEVPSVALAFNNVLSSLIPLKNWSETKDSL